jgi:hypothetical protein
MPCSFEIVLELVEEHVRVLYRDNGLLVGKIATGDVTIRRERGITEAAEQLDLRLWLDPNAHRTDSKGLAPEP